MGKRVHKKSPRKLPGTCLFCGLLLANYRNLVDHTHTHTEERPYSCNYCEFTFRNDSIRIAHEKKVHLLIKYKCNNCKRVFNDRGNFSKHRKICENKIKTKVFSKLKTNTGRKVKKPLTNKIISKLKQVITETNRKLNPKVKIQSISVAKSNLKPKPRSTSVLKLGLKKISDNKQVSEEEIKYPDYIWTHNGPPCMPPPLPPHLLQIENDNKWDPMFFLSMNRYKEEDSMYSSNFKIVSSNTQQKLDLSPPSPPTPVRGLLKVKKPSVKVKSKNMENKINKTEIKKENVKVENSIKSNENWTSDENSLTCHQCGKIFSHRGNVVRHLKIHDGEKPFICRFCNKGFSEKCNVIRHIASMHQQENQQDSSTTNPSSKKQFRCGFCGDTGSKDVRQICAHILSNHNELLYVEKS